MSFGEQVCLILNKFFPYKVTLGRNSPEEYIQQQIKWANQRYQLIGKYIDFNGKKVLEELAQ